MGMKAGTGLGRGEDSQVFFILIGKLWVLICTILLASAV